MAELGNFDCYDSDSFCFEVDDRSSNIFDMDHLLEGNDVNLASYSLVSETDFSLSSSMTTSAFISSKDFNCDKKNNASLLAKSPWHESNTSDSGMSETLSSLDSSQPSTPLTTILEDCKFGGLLTAFVVDENNMAGNNTNLYGNSAHNEELTSENEEFLNVLRGKDASSTENDNNIKATPMFFMKMKSRAPLQSHEINYTNIQKLNNSADSESEYSNSLNLISDVNDLNHNKVQQTKSSQNHADLKSCAEIKVVHIKPPISSGLTNGEVMKAVDERSKKNAQQAKINREKKKAYIKSLENDIDALKSQNEELNSENKKIKMENTDLVNEVKYLKSVLVNASALSSLLANINSVTEVKLSSSMRKRKSETDHNYIDGGYTSKQSRVSTNIQEGAGICLHVSGSQASLEFCAHCSSMAHCNFSDSSK